MAKCKVCGYESEDKTCPQCGRAKQTSKAGSDRQFRVSLVLCYLCVVVVFFLMKKVIPTFEDVFNSFGAALPAPTQWVIRLSHMDSVLYLSGSALTIGFITLLARPDLRDKLGPAVPLILFSIFVPVIVFLVAAMFMPMFDLGNVVK